MTPSQSPTLSPEAAPAGPAPAPPAPAPVVHRDDADLIAPAKRPARAPARELANVPVHPPATPPTQAIDVGTLGRGSARDEQSRKRDLDATLKGARDAVRTSGKTLEIVTRSTHGEPRAEAAEQAARDAGIEQARVHRTAAPARERPHDGRVDLRLTGTGQGGAASTTAAPSTTGPEGAPAAGDPFPHPHEPAVKPGIPGQGPLFPSTHPSAPLPKVTEVAPLPPRPEATRALLEALHAEPAAGRALDELTASLEHASIDGATSASVDAARQVAATRSAPLTGFALERILANPKSSELARRFLGGRALVVTTAEGRLKLQLVAGGDVREGGVLRVGLLKGGAR